MLNKSDLHDYQINTIEHILAHPQSMLWLDMGLGKTISILTAVDILLDQMKVYGVLVVAPLRVCQTVWRQEAKKWEHTKHLTFSSITGTKDERIRGLMTPADIYLINYDNLAWLQEEIEFRFLRKGKRPPFNMLVPDEISKLKNTRTRQGVARGKAMLKLLPYLPYRSGLTGTPASNGMLDLFGQFLVIDGGKRLGTSHSAFRSEYFYLTEYRGTKWFPFERAKEQIANRVGDITINMDVEDYIDMPEKIFNDIYVDLPPKQQVSYDKIEKEMMVELDSGATVDIFNAASKMNRCLQFANGAMYLAPGAPDWENVHDAKLDALEDIVEESAGQPILVAYGFQHDAHKILKKYPDAVWLSSKTSEADFIQALEDWNTGKLTMIIGHPACLHPSTQVLTQWRGWVKLIDVKQTEKVFDGIEFVDHDGCSYSGYEEVSDVFGITMTHNHKLLIADEWVEAADVRNSKEVKRKALYKYEGDDCRISEMFTLSDRVQNHSPECSEAQQVEKKLLSTLYSGHLPQYDGNSNLANMVRNESPCEGYVRPKLCRSWNWCVHGMGKLQQFLSRYARNVQRQSYNRKSGCEQGLLKKELHLGDSVHSTEQQENNTSVDLPKQRDLFSRISTSVRRQQNDADHAIEQRDVSRRSRGKCNEFTLREKQKTCEQKAKEHVYDLVNCGPRHRFLIRNDKGEVFVSHNSMGHGIDRLQHTGHILVFYGLTWSLDLYLQTIARLWRQGQGYAVMVHRLLTRDSLTMKKDDETNARDAIEAYRKRKGL